MKKIAQLIGVSLLLIGFSQTSTAQDIGFSAGAEIAIPLGDLGDASSLGIGFSGGLEYDLNESSGITGQLGYIFLIPKEGFSSGYLLPIQAGYKHYFDGKDSGLYGHGQLGVHTVSITTESISFFGSSVGGITVSETNLSLALGGGYIINENIDISLRFNMVTGDIGSNYIGIRGAYNF